MFKNPGFDSTQTESIVKTVVKVGLGWVFLKGTFIKALMIRLRNIRVYGCAILVLLRNLNYNFFMGLKVQ